MYTEDGKEKVIYQTHYLSDHITAFMVLRFIFLFKVILNYTNYNFFGSYKPSNQLIFKMHLVNHSEITISLMFIFSIFIFTALVCLFEIEELLNTTADRANNPMFLACYQVVVTVTSVGFGDLTAKTPEGRIIIMICAIWGGVLMAFIVLLVTNNFNLNDQ